MTNLPPIEPNAADEPVVFVAADGWELHGVWRCPPGDGVKGAAVLVHGSRHERDAYVYGRTLPDELASRGIASLRFDHRGRGESRRPRPWRELAPLERRRVADDIAAAVALVRDRAAIVEARVAIVAEQDAAPHALAAIGRADHVGALVLLSPRLGHVDLTPLSRVPVCALVSKEDRSALAAAAAAYLAGDPALSDLHVFAGLGFGTTMFMAQAFQHPDDVPLEATVAAWVVRALFR